MAIERLVLEGMPSVWGHGAAVRFAKARVVRVPINAPSEAIPPFRIN
jgi:hypothetical protein